MTALDLFLWTFHLSGLLVLAALYWRFRDRLRSDPWESADEGGGDNGGSDRIAPQPMRPWSWRRRPRPGGGGRVAVRRRRAPAVRR